MSAKSPEEQSKHITLSSVAKPFESNDLSLSADDTFLLMNIDCVRLARALFPVVIQSTSVAFEFNTAAGVWDLSYQFKKHKKEREGKKEFKKTRMSFVLFSGLNSNKSELED